MAYVYAACAVCVTIFSTGGKFQLVSNSTELHALTLAVRSYVLLVVMIATKDTLQSTISTKHHSAAALNNHDENYVMQGRPAPNLPA